LLGEQVAGTGGVFFNFPAERGHEDPQIVRLVALVGPPDLFEQEAMR
jgi:hypothetical protein